MIELAVNYFRTLAHYSDNLAERSPDRGPGRTGTALCDTPAAPVPVFDQLASDYDQVQRGTRRLPLDKPVTTLPVCPACTKIVANREGRGSAG